jgi:hypothetical protein
VKKSAVLGILFVFMLMSAGDGLAQQEHGSSVDFFLGLGSEPAGDVGTTFGFGAGLNIPFTNIFNAGGASGAADNLMIRADLSYFSWEGDTGPIDVEITRIPLFLGVRYFVSGDKIKTEGLGIYAEIGIELSFDDVEVKTPFLGTSSDDEINFGVPIGAGIQYYISEKWYLGFNARFHIISDSYFTLLGSIGFDL